MMLLGTANKLVPACKCVWEVTDWWTPRQHRNPEAILPCKIQRAPERVMIGLGCRPRRVISKRSLFLDPEASWACADRDSEAEQVRPALTSAARGNVGVRPQWLQADGEASARITILVHSLSPRPPGLRQATGSCRHSNGQVCRCPWESFLDRIPQLLLSVKGRPLRWMAVCLCRCVSFDVPGLPSSLSRLISSLSFLISECRNASLN